MDHIDQIEESNKQTLTDIRNQTIELLSEGDLSYDAYIKILVEAFNQNSDLETRLKHHLIEIFYETNSNHPHTSELYSQVKRTNERLLPLLFDPLIVTRYERFLKFIGDTKLDDSTSIMEFRKQFITTKFLNRTLFRAVRVNPDEVHLNSHLANKVRLTLQYIDRILIMSEPQSRDEMDLYMTFHPNRLVFLDGIAQDAVMHVKGGATELSQLISVSEHPEIAWMAVATHGEERWRNFEPGTSISIARFEMSEFYAPARSEFPSIGSFLKRARYRVNDKYVYANSSEVERLVPLALPEDWDKDSIVYPVNKNIFGIRTLPKPRASDWD